MGIHSDSQYEDVFRPLRIPGLEVTNETLVDVYLSADQDISAGTWTTLNLDTVNKDERGEFDTGTHQFTPEETGWYFVTMSAQFNVGADQDRIYLRFYNATDDSVLSVKKGPYSGANPHILQSSDIYRLDSGDNYEVDVLNNDSSDTINGVEIQTYLAIRRMFR